jgi:hypothetical protein
MSSNRYAVSLLDKSRKSEAIDQEVLINKLTGEILVKSAAGIFISYNKIAKFDAHIKDVTTLCHGLNFLGNMYELEFDNIDLPNVVEEDINLLSGATTFSADVLTKILISVDLDSLRIDAGEAKRLDTQPTITIDMTLATNITDGGITYGIVRTLPLDSSNITIFNVDYPEADPGDVVDYTATINSIYITRDPSNASDTLRFVLNSVLIVLK